MDFIILMNKIKQRYSLSPKYYNISAHHIQPISQADLNEYINKKCGPPLKSFNIWYLEIQNNSDCKQLIFILIQNKCLIYMRFS